MPYYGFQNKAIEPLGETRSHLQIAIELAAKLGLSEFKGKNEEGILKEMIRDTVIPDYETFKRKTVHRIEQSEPYVAFKKQIEDPVGHPFPTPSGKIEIYSQQLADMKDPLMPPIPKFIEPWEGRGDPLSAKYPLQLVTLHFRKEGPHAQNDSIPWLREVQTQEIQISPADALCPGGSPMARW